MLVVYSLFCVNNRYLISQTFISPIERRIIIFVAVLCILSLSYISLIISADIQGFDIFFKRIVLNGACFPLLSKNVDFHSFHDGIPWNELSLKHEFDLMSSKIETFHIAKMYGIMLEDNASGPRISQKVIT